jgi:hypothetical protein
MLGKQAEGKVMRKDKNKCSVYIQFITAFNQCYFRGCLKDEHIHFHGSGAFKSNTSEDKRE